MSLPKDNYIISRDANEAERLDLQHRCIASCQGYYLHPDVAVPQNARVAELCTGTTIWLREVALAHPDAEFHGFDISDKMYPNEAELPQNIQLHLADVKKPFENFWLGYFDVIHIRLIMAAMRTSEWGPTLQNITTLLKPGGWLQWYEDDRPVAVRHASRPVAPSGVAGQEISKGNPHWCPPRIRDLARFSRSIMPDDRAEAMNYGYMNLDALMADPDVGNLEQVGCDAFIIDRSDDGGKLRRDWAVMGVSAGWNMIRAREDVGAKIADISRDEWADLAMKEIESGAHFISHATVFTGRKKN